MNSSDIAIISRGSSTPDTDLRTLLSAKLRNNNHRFKFTFSPTALLANTNAYTLTDNNTTIEKVTESWDCCFVSDIPLTNKINYFEIELVKALYNGIYFGVTDEPHLQHFTGVNDRIIALYNSANGHNSGRSGIVETFDAADARSGAIIGVVVDLIQSKIEFYLNGKLIAVGSRKLSELGKLYVFISAYYMETTLKIVEKYQFSELRRNK